MRRRATASGWGWRRGHYDRRHRRADRAILHPQLARALGPGRLRSAPMQRFDKVALLVLLAALHALGGPALQPRHGRRADPRRRAHLARLARWAGHRTLAEPLVAVLHAGYAFLPLGALAIGTEIIAPGRLGAAAAQHLWMGGADGLMTIAVMTRATLGHTGQLLTAGPGTVAIYLALVAAVLARVAAGAVAGGRRGSSTAAAGLLWIGAFGGFALVYGPLLLRLPAAKAG